MIRLLGFAMVVLVLSLVTACRAPQAGDPAPGVSDRNDAVESVLARNRPGIRSGRTSARSAHAPADVARGRAIYQRRCGTCHALHAPESYSDTEWRPIVRTMGRNAHLSRADQKLVLDYLVASN